MSGTAKVTADQAGTISINGYNIDIVEGDTLDTIMDKVMDGANMAGGRAFAVSSLLMIRRLTEVIMQDISQIHLTQATDLL